MSGSVVTGGGSRLTGTGSVLTSAGDSCEGGGPVVFPLSDLVWEYATGEYLPSDNLDAHSCAVAGALTAGGALVPGGSRVILNFTADGGEPTNGAPVYLASSQDDTNTGRGKATATPPSTSMPALPLWTQNLVIVGICVDNTNYAADGTCVVHLLTPAVPNYVVPADETYNLHRVTATGDSDDNFTNATEGDWGDGESIMAIFSVDQTAVGDVNGYVVLGSDGVNFWGIGGSVAILVTADTVGGAANCGLPFPGLNVVVATKTGGQVRASMNGAAVATHAYASDVPSPALLRIGSTWTRGGVTGVAKFNRVLSDAELVAFSRENTANRAVFGGNIFAPSATAREDAGCLWYLDLTGWTGGSPSATAGPAGAGFPLTVNGAPISTAFSYTVNRNPAGLYLDGPAPAYDSNYYARDRQAQRIAYTVSTIFDLALLIIGYALNDTDNADEGSVGVIVDGVPLLAIGAVDTNVVRYSPIADNLNGSSLDIFATLGPGPWLVEIIVGDKINRYDTFDSGGAFNAITISGAAVMQTAATARRLTVISDSITMMAHQSDFIPGVPAAGAPITRARATFPGRITAVGCSGNFGTALLKAWGNDDVEPYAKYSAALAQEGAPLARQYLCALGFADWFQTAVTVAQFEIDYGAFVDALHAEDAGADICIAEIVQTELYPNLNFNGDTLSEFNDAIVAIAAARPWLTLLDLSGPNVITFDNGGGPLDMCPSNPDGQIALTDNMQAAAVIGWP